jgi:hypothetical protein
MSDPHLPAEMLDHIVDHLHDTEDALKNCCLVSKSWIPRTRKHLFANIKFQTAKNLRLRKETFPDPSTSPAYYTKALFVGCPGVVTAADAEAGGWIRGFSCVVHLVLADGGSFPGGSLSLVPFHGFSPALKSLYMVFTILPLPWVPNLILSFPLLEDLTVLAFPEDASIDSGDGSDRLPTAAQPPSPSMFTGTLELSLNGIKYITRQLLSLPGGIHFRKLDLEWFHEEDRSGIIELVEGCSHTLESLRISLKLRSASILPLCPHR